MSEIPDTLRLALFLEWDQRCVWCGVPLDYRQMEVDHLIAQSLTGQELSPR